MNGPPSRNWFDAGGGNYARFRPDYPDALSAFLAGIAPGRGLALDVGCGNGQFTRQLADHFDHVTGQDSSADQIAHAAPHPHVDYQVAPAERLTARDGSVDLIAAAQAAHWFDLPRFYAGARRVAVPGACIALVSYGVMRLEPALNARFLKFYIDEIGPCWPPERALVDGGYSDIDFPFAEREAPHFAIRRAWDAHALLGYISTWSAVRHAREAGREEMLTGFARDLLDLWGDPAMQRQVEWPVAMRLGHIG